MITKQDVLTKLLPEFGAVATSSEHFAPSNIALCKYWGKRDAELNLPINPSLSVSLNDLGSRTRVTPIDQPIDEVWLNGQQMHHDSQFSRRVSQFIDLFRGNQSLAFKVETRNNIPTAAGLASSASGFAALTLAMNDALSLDLSKEALSMIARMGSGSACRSIFDGFVEWHMGHREDGLDSHAHPIDASWEDLRIGLVKVDIGEKSVDSRSGMQRTKETSHLYNSWPAQANADLSKLHQAIAEQDFALLGSTAEHNAMSMHATFASSWPPLVYWQPESLEAMHKVWHLRAQGLEVYFTMDAGPNLKLLFQKDALSDLLAHFPELEVVTPFCA
jgi:diphosphomevalonate decarboxylase